MKKWMSLVMAAAMTVSLAACGGTKSAETSAAAAGGNSAQATTEAAKKSGPVYTLSIGTEATEDTLFGIYCTSFKEELEKRTDGALAVRVFLNSELGDELSMLEQTRSGDMDAVIIGGANFASLVPELQVLSVPYLWNSFEDFRTGMSKDNEVYQILQKYVADKNAGVYLAAPTTSGCRWVANVKGPISNPDDMKKLNLVMRIMANPIEATTWTTFGANTTNMPMPDVFTAMQQGVVDCVENSPDIMYKYKIQEVAHYFSMTEHNWFFSAVVASDKLKEKVPEEYQTALEEAFNAAAEHTFDVTPETLEKSVKALEESGVEIVKDVDKEAFQSMISDLYDQVAKDNNAEDLLAACRKVGK